MTILEPILYANGALRLTRHGAGKGGNILVLEVDGEGTTEQVELTDQGVLDFERLVAKYEQEACAEVALNETDARPLFNAARRQFAA
jgi:hypothetical protein